MVKPVRSRASIFTWGNPRERPKVVIEVGLIIVTAGHGHVRPPHFGPLFKFVESMLEALDPMVLFGRKPDRSAKQLNKAAMAKSHFLGQSGNLDRISGGTKPTKGVCDPAVQQKRVVSPPE